MTNYGITFIVTLSMFTLALMVLREEEKYILPKSINGKICLAAIDAVRTVLLIAVVFIAVILPTQM